MAHDVFISYSSKDKPTADAACAVLEARGIRCWIAPRDILPGMDWGESIVDAIAASRVMVLIFSGNANASPQVKREAERAVHHDVVIVPLRIESVPPNKSLEYFISTPHWLDALNPPLDQHLNRLADTLAALLARPHESGASGATPSPLRGPAVPPIPGRPPPRTSWQQPAPPSQPASYPPAQRPPTPAMPVPQEVGNGLAVVSFATSLIGCFTFIPSLVGVVTGWIALRRARRPGVGGRGLATAGLVLGLLGVVAWVLLGGAISLFNAHEAAARPTAEQFLRHMAAGDVAAAGEESDSLPRTDLEALFAKNFTSWGSLEAVEWDSPLSAMLDDDSPTDTNRTLLRGTATFAHRVQPVRIFMHETRGAWRVQKFEALPGGRDN